MLIHYRTHDNYRVRVWLADWFGDQFEIMTETEFWNLVERINYENKLFQVKVVYHDIDED